MEEEYNKSDLEELETKRNYWNKRINEIQNPNPIMNIILNFINKITGTSYSSHQCEEYNKSDLEFYQRMKKNCDYLIKEELILIEERIK